MLDLALRPDGETVMCRDIAVRQEIPEAYLIQIMTALRRAGLVASRRGPGGGHLLARKPNAISLGDIVGALEGPFGAAWQVQSEGTGTCAGTLHEFWQSVDASARRAVDQVTLADLAERTRVRTPTYRI